MSHRSHRPIPLVLAFFLHATILQAQVAWVRKFDDALKQATAEGKFVVVDISANWCPPCQEMARNVHPNSEFVEFSRSQVFVLLDAEDNSEGTRIARKYNVDTYPTILVLEANGREIDRLIGGRNATGLIGDLKKIFANPVPYDELLRRAASLPDSFQMQFDVGERALDRKDSAKARQLLGRAVTLSTAEGMEVRSRALLLFSLACFRDGKYQESLKAMDDLAKLNPRIEEQIDDLRLQRARLLIALKRSDEAGLIISELLRSSRSRSEIDGAKKLLAQLPGKYRKGDADYAAALEKAKDNFRKGKFDAATELARKAVERAPQSAEVHQLLAAIHFRKSDGESDPAAKGALLTAGLDQLRLARRLDPEDILSYKAARGYMAAQYLPEIPSSPEARKAFAEAEQRFAETRYQDAAKLYLKTMQLDPGFGKAYLHLGDCYFVSGKIPESLEWYVKAITRSPLDAAAHRFAADALSKLGRHDEARKRLVSSLLADPEYPLVWTDLETAARREGRSLERHSEIVPFQLLMPGSDGYAYSEKLFDDVPQVTVPAWRQYVKAKLIWRQEKFRKRQPAAAFYHTTFEEELDCLQQLVSAWNDLKQQNPALRDENLDFLRQVEIDGMLDAYVFVELFTEEYRTAFEHWKQKNGQRAVEYLNRFVFGAAQARSRGEYNASAIVAFNSGLESHRAGDKAKALELYRKALAQEPRMVPALTNISAIYVEDRDFKNARETLLRWMEAAPESSQPMAMLAPIQFNEGHREEAMRLLEKAVALEADPAHKAQYQQMLAGMRQVAGPAPFASTAYGQQDVAGTPPVLLRRTSTRESGDTAQDERVAALQRNLETARDESERDAIHLMLAVAHFEARRWKEARVYLVKVLNRDPNNFSAQEMLKVVEQNLRP